MCIYQAQIYFLQRVKKDFVDMEQDFRREVASLVPHLLGGDNLVMKRINGQEITCRELLEYFRVCGF